MAVVVQSSTTMINAAFLQEVKDSNVELWDAVHRLRVMIEEAGDATRTRISAEQTRSFVTLLGQLRDLLAFEFSLEEAYGYIEGCRGAPSIAGQRAAAAKLQHRELYLLIHELCEQAEEAQYRGAVDREYVELMAAAAEFDAQLRAHEQLEAELATAAFRGL